MTTCPAAPAYGLTQQPGPGNLAYSLTLPNTPTSPTIARAATRTVLAAHGLEAAQPAALQAVGELVACAGKFTHSTEIYLSLRYRDRALRVIVYDDHPRHDNPHLAASCEARRRASLRLLARVAESCGGDWGFGPAREPGAVTRTWAVLPHQGLTTYAPA